MKHLRKVSKYRDEVHADVPKLWRDSSRFLPETVAASSVANQKGITFPQMQSFYSNYLTAKRNKPKKGALTSSVCSSSKCDCSAAFAQRPRHYTTNKASSLRGTVRWPAARVHERATHGVERQFTRQLVKMKLHTV